MWRQIGWVAAGGALGAVLRYGTVLVLRDWSLRWPLGTLAVNGLGCFAIGFLAHLALQAGRLSPELRLLLITGVCGGYTTLSAMVYEFMELGRGGAWWAALAYVVVSVTGGMLLFIGGHMVARAIWRG